MSGYIGAVPVPEATQNRTSHTATAGQTTFAVDYTVGFIDVFLNGIKLANEDFTATNGSSVVLASAAAVNDIFDTISYTAFNPADTVAASTGGTFAGNVAVTGNISVTGTVDGRDVAQAIPATLGSAGQVLTVNGGASAAAWASPAGSFASLSDTTVSASDPTISTNPASGVGHMWINTTTGFVYVLRDATAGANIWTNVGRGQYDVDPLHFVTATGGTVTTDGDFKVHTFNSSGNFVVTNTSGTLRPITYLMIAGGGSGGGTAATDYVQGGGGGAGGFFTATVTPSLNTSYTIVIGGGGAYSTSWTNVASGSNTTFYGLTALGGGKGGSGYNDGSSVAQAADGGSGGGRGIWGEGTQGGSSAAVGRVGLGTTGQGNNGGSSLNGITGSNRYPVAAGGGGGAGGLGLTPTVQGTGGAGGTGVSSSVSGVGAFYAGGGGGGGSSTSGVGGNGGASINAAGLPNTGAGGAGAHGNRNNGSSGGSGVVIIRYQFQD